MAFGDPKSRSTALWLFLFFAAALALRIVFSVGVGFDDSAGRQVFTGNDPYYHDRSLRHLLETGENLNHDPSINYPDGRSNPNPPLFIWTTAPLALALEATGAEDPTGTALNIMTAFWGALIVFPVFVLARDLWGRGAGLWAGFFAALSAPYIQRSIWGYADHDAISMFFITLAFVFLVKAFRAVKPREYVADWSKGPSRSAGIKAAYTENKRAFLFSALAGVALTACALVWKGYPYALAVLAVGLALQLIADHLRNRDSTPLFGLYLLPLLIVVVLPYLLYYRLFPEFLPGTIFPSLYVLIGAIVAGLVLVPTRQIPSIVIFPALLLAGLVGLALLLWVFPAAGYQVFSGLGYFNQSKLYTTIAEAQRAQLGFVAASFGFFTFLIGFWGYGKAVKGAWKGEPAFMLVAAWATVAFFMAFAASRFVMNAVPVFAVLIGAAMAALMAWLGFGEVARRWRATQGQGLAARSARSMGWKQSVGVALVVLFLVLPNVWIGVDAAMPAEYEQDKDLSDHYFGAFGISFDLKDNGWLDTMEYLAQQDTGLPEADRPAVIAWWDYGHWNIGLGRHPTVADPFQSHFELAGRFLASESEAEAQSWLTILLLNYDWGRDGAGYSAAVRQALDSRSPGLADAVSSGAGYDGQYDALSAKVNGTAVFGLYRDVSDATDKHIGYMAADVRMYPFSSCNSGIFYAPVFLANKNPDDFLQTSLSAGTQTLTLQQYGVDEAGNSYRLKDVRVVDSAGTEWEVYNGYAYRPGQTPLDGFPADSGTFIGDCRSQQMTPTGKFTGSMFARAYGGAFASQPAGSGLTHWHVVQQTTRAGFFGPGQPDGRLTVLLQYYEGTNVTGRVVETGGAPMAGVQVSVTDAFGGAHGTVTTDDQGRFTVLAPPGSDLKLTVQSGGATLYERGGLAVPQDEGAPIAVPDLVVAPGTLTGHVYENTDGTSGFNATGDKPLAGAKVTAAGKTATTGEDGSYTISDVRAGTHGVTVSLAGYNNATQSANVRSGNTTTLDVALAVKTSQVTLRFLDTNGTAVAGVPMQVTGGALTAARTATTNAQGNATMSLAAGSYHVKVDYNVTPAGGSPQRYQAEQDFTVPPGGGPVTVVVNRQ